MQNTAIERQMSAHRAAFSRYLNSNELPRFCGAKPHQLPVYNMPLQLQLPVHFTRRTTGRNSPNGQHCITISQVL